MKNKTAFLICIILLTLSSFSQTYITNVTIIDVEKQKLVPGQTVSITGDIISDIRASNKTKIPTGVTVIDGSGKYLLPGMTDAHVHFFQSGGLYARPDAIDLRKDMPYEKEIAWSHNNMEDFLRRYMMLGITSVIDVGSTINFLEQKDSFAEKKYAPAIYMTGPLLTSYEPKEYQNLKKDEPFSLVKTAEEGIKYVQQQLPYRPDFIKIWYIANTPDDAKKFQPVAKAIIDEAHKNNLKVAVHATERVTAQLAVESGCDYLVHDIEDEIVPDDFIQLLKSKKVIICPTLIVADGYDNAFAQKNQYTLYDLVNSNPQQIGSITDLKHLPDSILTAKYKNHFRSKAVMNSSAHQDSVRMANLKKMSDAGVTIVAGTDAGNIGTQHASSFFSELIAMQKSGMNNWQIIISATINSSKMFDKEKTEGSIAIGKKANAILLNANPVEDLENLKKIDFVINRGFVIDPDTLIKETPLALVQRQLNAYNVGNINAFLEPYADDVELYDFPGKLLGKGKNYMRLNYAKMFNKLPDLHCEVKERIIQGNTIIDKEKISGTGNDIFEATAIYEIENNKIRRVYFVQ